MVVSEVGSSKSIPDPQLNSIGSLDCLIADITNHDYEVWNAAYERGYKNGRDHEAKMHSGLELSRAEVQAINKLALSMGYISHEDHESFLMLLKRLEDV